MKELVKTITELSNLVGVSSREFRIAEYIKSYFEGSKYQIDEDYIGNVTIKHPSYDENKENLLIFAHMDEIGLIIRKISEDGYLYFERLGGVNTQILPGTRFVLDGNNGFVHGVVGVKSHHFMPVEDKFVVPPLKDQFIDIGVSSYKEVLDKGINVGTYGAYDSKCEVIDDKLIRGKSLDNRCALGILLNIAKEIENEDLSYNLFICFPVMEEFNIRGLMPVYRKVKPKYAIGLDVTPACDTPNLDYNDVKLGRGPAICYMNFHSGGTLAGVLPDKELLEAIEKVAEENKINYQREISPGIITENAFGLFENENGIKVANLSIPTRYTHTPFETISIEDAESLYRLTKHILLNKF